MQPFISKIINGKAVGLTNMEQIGKPKNLREELAQVINEFSIENASNTADFVLAEYLLDCLRAYEKAVNWRESLKAKQNKEVTGKGNI